MRSLIRLQKQSLGELNSLRGEGHAVLENRSDFAPSKRTGSGAQVRETCVRANEVPPPPVGRFGAVRYGFCLPVFPLPNPP